MSHDFGDIPKQITDRLITTALILTIAEKMTNLGDEAFELDDTEFLMTIGKLAGQSFVTVAEMEEMTGDELLEMILKPLTAMVAGMKLAAVFKKEEEAKATNH